MSKIERASGIYERRISAADECASDLAVNAAQNLISASGIDKSSIDLLVFATQTPDYLIPTTACIIQERLGLGNSVAAFDINLGCSQYPYAIAVASSWIKCGLAKKALVLTGDTVSKLVNPMDRSAVSIFSDGASATLLEASIADSFLGFDFGTDGSGFSDLICPASAMRIPPNPSRIANPDDNGNMRSDSDIYVNGIKIFSFSYKVAAQSVERLLQKSGLSTDDIDLFLFHQAGEKIVKSSADRIGIAPEKLYVNYPKFGNCGGSSVPIALAQAAEEGRLKAGMKVVLCAFGAGLSWGSALVEIPQNFAVAEFKE